MAGDNVRCHGSSKSKRGPSKRKLDEDERVKTCPSNQQPRNVISWLIESRKVSPRCKCYYRGKGCRNTLGAEGRITRHGIKCNCCGKMYSVGGFVHHSGGSTTSIPSASIFLKDGRSILDCQIEAMLAERTKECEEKPVEDPSQDEGDDSCTICSQDVGTLLLCDKCPSAFHKECLGLQDIPEGNWFCPSCRCAICSQVKKEETKDNKQLLSCIQCERKYHVECLNNRESIRDVKNWGCGKECEQIYAGLRKLLGQPVSVGADNLTWTLVKYDNSESSDVGGTKDEFLAESYSKLRVALSVMNECFEPTKCASSSGDLMEDIIFSRRSEHIRLNFQGFYTVLLERNEELICVANVRVYGEKVAEVPFVGTRFQYRRLGMARILMNELEKMLMQLGVEKLVLPAAPDVLETWTKSFRFEKMSSFERSQLLEYALLDLPGTVMCQKRLRKTASPAAASTRV